jgi:hypothetical protein
MIFCDLSHSKSEKDGRVAGSEARRRLVFDDGITV